MAELTCSHIPRWISPGHTMHSLSECEPCSWLLLIFWCYNSLSPAQLGHFCNSKFIQNGTYGSNKWSLPIVDRHHTFSYASWLLWQWSLVIAVSLGWRSDIYGPRTIPTVPPFLLQELRTAELNCSSIPRWIRPCHSTPCIPPANSNHAVDCCLFLFS